MIEFLMGLIMGVVAVISFFKWRENKPEEYKGSYPHAPPRPKFDRYGLPIVTECSQMPECKPPKDVKYD